MKKFKLAISLCYILMLLASCVAFFYGEFCHVTSDKIFASAQMPFYDLQPKGIILRAKFYTSYSQSSPERKHNIKLAASKIDKTFLDVNAEFSFNKTVGDRTEENGFQKAKIIINNRFVEGYGGGVCQASTTLYNAVILSGLEVTEYHPHSLPVSYVAPSFDAMVNSGSADLRFINNTKNPIIITAEATESQITICIFGQPMREKYVRQSLVTGEISAPPEEIVFDDNLDYPDLYEGERKVLSYSKNGLTSEGVLIKYENGKIISSRVIRKDAYNAMRGIIIIGRASPPQTDGDAIDEDFSYAENLSQNNNSEFDFE